MPTDDPRGWLGLPRVAPGQPRRTGADRDDEPLLKRWFWPPDAYGAIIIALVVAVVFGFFAGLIYTRSEKGTITTSDPVAETGTTGPAGEPGAPGSVSSTTKPANLSPEALGRKVAPSVWAVSTLDLAGRPVEGSAFVIGASGGQTLLLTSLATVKAATTNPGPVIAVRNRGSNVNATLWTWDEGRDLALLVITTPAPTLKWAGPSDPDDNGKVYAVVGGGGVTAGMIAGPAGVAIPHDISTDGLRQGAPLLNAKGEVLGMMSRDYDPGGRGTDKMFFAVPVGLSCDRVLKCGSGNTNVDAKPPVTLPGGAVASTKPAPASTNTTRRP